MGRKKNKNRHHGGGGGGGDTVSRAKNSPPNVSASNVVGQSSQMIDVMPVNELGQSKQTIADAKSKVEQLEESVNSIKENLTQLKKIESAEQCSKHNQSSKNNSLSDKDSKGNPPMNDESSAHNTIESNTLKKKRNRNQKRRKDNRNRKNDHDDDLAEAENTTENVKTEEKEIAENNNIDKTNINEIIEQISNEENEMESIEKCSREKKENAVVDEKKENNKIEPVLKLTEGINEIDELPDADLDEFIQLQAVLKETLNAKIEIPKEYINKENDSSNQASISTKAKQSEPAEQTKVAKIGKTSVKKESKPKLHLKMENINEPLIKLNDSIDIASVNESKLIFSTPPSTPIFQPTNNINKPLQTEDETSKIRKILEEASKSLDPVEIAMEIEPIKLIKKPNEKIEHINENILVPLIKDGNVKPDKTEKLNAVLLETKKCPKPEPRKLKNENESIQEKSPKNVAKEVKPITPKFDKQPVVKEEKLKDPPPIQEENLSEQQQNDILDSEIPLDMSIISIQSINTTEVNLDMPSMVDENITEVNQSDEIMSQPKNVQGSDFAPSAEGTANVAKSLQKKQPNEKKTNVKNVQKIDEKPKTNSLNNSKVLTVEKSVNGNSTGNAPNTSKTSQQKLKASPPKTTPIAQSKQTSVPKNQEPIQKPSTSQKSIVQQRPEHLMQKKPEEENPHPIPIISNSVNKQNKSDQTPTKNDINKNEGDGEKIHFVQYKFMPRQVFLHNICHICKKPLIESSFSVQCSLCHMVSYCNQEHLDTHKEEHNDLCTAIQEIAKKRGGHVYNNARILNSTDYRSLRVHTLNICENFLKRSLQTFEREILLFPRVCCLSSCREWRQNQLTDCNGCYQISFCAAHRDHQNIDHDKWCDAYKLYQKLVIKQSINGRIEPNLPLKIMNKAYTLPNDIDAVFNELYDDFTEIKEECIYATLTQQATAPLTAFYATQKSNIKIDETFTIHLVGAELQFEADVLDIWEVFFLHLAYKLKELSIVFCGPELNTGNIPLDILGRIRMCRACRKNCRIVKFDFECGRLYHDYVKESSFKKPDLICFFNPGLHRVTGFNGLDTWSDTIRTAIKLNCPILLTSYTEIDSAKEMERIQSEVIKEDKNYELKIIQLSNINKYASKRPERNFISDDIAPLIFKNYYSFIVK